MVQLSYPYMTTGKTITLTRWTFVGKVMSLLFNMLSRFVITSKEKALLALITRKWILIAIICTWTHPDNGNCNMWTISAITFLSSTTENWLSAIFLYGFSNGHVWMWELDYKESRVQKNWCFWTVVLEKTLESPLDCKEIQPVHSKGDQSWVFIGRTDVEDEPLIFWPLQAKSWLIWKDPDVGKDWRQEEKGTTEDEMIRWHHQLNGHEFE